jgi:hypothetical protein
MGVNGGKIEISLCIIVIVPHNTAAGLCVLIGPLRKIGNTGGFDVVPHVVGPPGAFMVDVEENTSVAGDAFLAVVHAVFRAVCTLSLLKALGFLVVPLCEKRRVVVKPHTIYRY